MLRISVAFDRYTGPQRRGVLRNALTFLLLFTVFFIFLPIKPTYAQENVWRLTETIINPDNEKLEFHGGGSDPAYYAEERYKGNPFNAFSYSSPSVAIGSEKPLPDNTLRTGEGSAKVVIFPRYWADKNVIRIGTKSEVVFTRFGTADQDISVSQTLIEMVRGWVRV